ncbi:MAG: hypothetical protein U0Q15_01280 [Kineosporiaceae bacterium]
MTADVFEVFDQRSPAPNPRRPGRGAQAKSAFAIVFSLALLAAMGFGAWYGVKALTAADPQVCTAEQTGRQASYEDWLTDLAAQAFDKRDATVNATGCVAGSTAPSAELVLVDDAALQAVLSTLRESGCPKLAAKVPATCTLDTERGVLAVAVGKVTDDKTDGDYLVTVTTGTLTTAG